MKTTITTKSWAAIALLMCSSVAQAQTSESMSNDNDADNIDEIIVTGIFDEPDRLTGSAHRVDEVTLEAFKYDDINRILNLVPGVYVREEDGVGLRPNIGLRGGSADRSQKVALMEDGVLLSPAPYSAPAAYFFPLSTRMVGVEVYKGPAAIQYGPQTIGGAINLVSAPIPSDAMGSIEAGGGSYGYRHLHAKGGNQTDKLGFLVDAVHIGSDGFKDIDGGGDSGFEKNEIMLKAARTLGPGVLELRFNYADEVSNETYLGLTEQDLRDDPYRRYAASVLDRMEWDWFAARADWAQPLFGGTLNVTGYTQHFDRAWRKFNNFSGANIGDVLANPDAPFNQLFVTILNGGDTDGLSGTLDDIRIGTNDRSFNSSGVQGALRWDFGTETTHTLEVGARLHVDKIQRLHDEFGYEQTSGEIVLNSTPRAIVTDNTGYTEALSVWIHDEIAKGPWTIVPGLRVEAIQNSFTNRLANAKQDNDYVVAIPGIGVNYEVNEDLRLLIGVHQGFSPAIPSLAEDLDAEESINYELGGRWRSPFGRIEVIGFLNDYSNLTAICTVSSGCASGSNDTQTNAGEVETSGIELGWNHEFRLGSGLSMPAALTYTYTKSEFQESFDSVNPQFGVVEPGFELPYVPPHRANLNVGLLGDKWGVNVSVSYIDRMRDRAGAGSFSVEEGSDSATIIDVSANYRVSDRWNISARVDNVADDVYVVSRRPFGARPGKPLSAQLLVAMQF
ncbi:MAG: TonB-dependent receptor [Pseudomonadota bacterium]